MAISRMQMNRQLYAGGGIMDVTPREKFGLGSSLKKFVRKIIPNEVADIATKAAPFVAPFNPLLAAGMAGIGGFDQTGSISKSLRSGALTYGLGNLARVVGGAGPQFGLKAQGAGTGFGSYFTSPMSGQQLFGAQAPVVDSGATVQSLDEIVGPGGGIEEYLYKTDPSKLTLGQQADIIAQQVSGGTPKTGYSDILGRIVGKDATLGQRTQAIKELGGKALKDIYTTDKGKVDKMALAGTIAGVGSYLEAKKLAEDAGLVDEGEEYTEEMYNADKAKYAEKYGEYLTPEAFGLKDGGRIGYANGSGISSIKLEDKDYNFMDLIDKEGEEDYYIKKAEELDRKYNPQNYTQILPKEKPMDQYMLNEIMSERGMNTLSEETRDEAMKMYAERAFKKGQISEAEYNEIMGYKKGGRVGYKDAGFTTVKDLGIEKEEIEPKFQYDLKDLDIERDKSKVLVMDKDGSTKIMDKEIAETLGLKIIADSFDTELMKKAKGGRVGYKDAGLSSLADYERQERLAELESLIDKLMTEEGIQDKGYAARLAGDLINMKNKGIDSDRLKFLNEKSALYALPTNMRPEPEYYDALNALEKRTNRKLGSPEKGEEGIVSLDIDMGDDEDNMMMADAPGITFTTSEKSYLFKTLAGQGGSDRSFTMPQLYGILNNPNTPTNIGDAKALKAFLKMKGFKTGGRVQYAMGSPEQNAMAASEVSGIPLNINPAGATELDMRDTGGFVPPVGVKEKADDIPAMLSNNEFVFTAKSVKEMGDGDVNKGAQRMYAMMKKLENGGRV